MKNTIFDPYYDEDSYTDDEKDAIKNNTISHLIAIRNIYEKQYSKIIRLYFLCIASCYFAPTIIYAHIYAHKIRNGENPYIKNKTTFPLVIGTLIAIFQALICVFFFLQLKAGTPMIGVFAQIAVPSITASGLIFCFFLLANLKYKYEKKNRDAIFYPAYSHRTRIRILTDKLLTKITKIEA